VALYLHPQYVFMAWCLIKHRGNFALPYLTLRRLWTVDILIHRQGKQFVSPTHAILTLSAFMRLIHEVTVNCWLI